MQVTPLISATELQSHLGNANLRIIDCRHDLANVDAGRAAYAASHIAGAQFMSLDDDLSGPKTGQNGRHPLPDVAVLTAKLAQLGISKASHVVAYDASGGPFAARLWWLLRWIGCESVQVLDGGWTAWQSAGGAVSSDVPTLAAVQFNAQVDHARHVSAADVVSNLSTAAFQIVDARSAERFVGVGETLDPVGGHIPGAKNRFFMLNLADGQFKSPQILRDEWLALIGNADASTLVHQCGSGVTACHNLLALEVAGLSGSRLYPGSWSEWCSDATRPVAQ